MTKRETGYTVRGLKVWATAGLMLMLVLSSGLALASSSFTVTNNYEHQLEVLIYHGDDGSCIYPQKEKFLDSGKTEELSCKGDGTHHCKAIFQYKNVDGIWKKEKECGNHTCSGKAIRVPNGSTLVLDLGSCTWE